MAIGVVVMRGGEFEAADIRSAHLSFDESVRYSSDDHDHEITGRITLE